jgi:sterol 14-demethylase
MDPSILTAPSSTVAILFVSIVAAKVILTKIVDPTRGKGQLMPPPMVSGASLLAALPTLVTKGLEPILHNLHTKLGSVFTVNLFGLKKVTFLVGPEVTTHLFQGLDSEICHPDLYNFTVPIFGKGIMFNADFTTRSKQIHLCADALRTPELRRNADSMVREVQVSKL